jgi:hypothetical protein
VQCRYTTYLIYRGRVNKENENKLKGENMTVEGTEPEVEQDDSDFEMLILALLVAGAILLGYRNKAKIKKWFDDIIGKLK